MNKEEVMKIIFDEKLRGFNWFEDHDIRPNEVGIQKNANKWSVYTTDERANPISQKEFESESDALENFMKRLRALDKYGERYR